VKEKKARRYYLPVKFSDKPDTIRTRASHSLATIVLAELEARVANGDGDRALRGEDLQRYVTLAFEVGFRVGYEATPTESGQFFQSAEKIIAKGGVDGTAGAAALDSIVHFILRGEDTDEAEEGQPEEDPAAV
jgi:hypothetical protein